MTLLVMVGHQTLDIFQTKIDICLSILALIRQNVQAQNWLYQLVTVYFKHRYWSFMVKWWFYTVKGDLKFLIRSFIIACTCWKQWIRVKGMYNINYMCYTYSNMKNAKFKNIVTQQTVYLHYTNYKLPNLVHTK